MSVPVISALEKDDVGTYIAEGKAKGISVDDCNFVNFNIACTIIKGHTLVMTPLLSPAHVLPSLIHVSMNSVMELMPSVLSLLPGCSPSFSWMRNGRGFILTATPLPGRTSRASNRSAILRSRRRGVIAPPVRSGAACNGVGVVCHQLVDCARAVCVVWCAGVPSRAQVAKSKNVE